MQNEKRIDPKLQQSMPNNMTLLAEETRLLVLPQS